MVDDGDSEREDDGGWRNFERILKNDMGMRTLEVVAIGNEVRLMMMMMLWRREEKKWSKMNLWLQIKKMKMVGSMKKVSVTL